MLHNLSRLILVVKSTCTANARSCILCEDTLGGFLISLVVRLYLSGGVFVLGWHSR